MRVYLGAADRYLPQFRTQQDLEIGLDGRAGGEVAGDKLTIFSNSELVARLVATDQLRCDGILFKRLDQQARTAAPLRLPETVLEFLCYSVKLFPDAFVKQ